MFYHFIIYQMKQKYFSFSVKQHKVPRFASRFVLFRSTDDDGHY